MSRENHEKHRWPIERPRLIIRASSGWRINLKQMWAYRGLLYFFTLRDIKVRYRQTSLGIFWAIFQPLASMVVFSVFFKTIVNISSEGTPYPISVYASVLLWTLFSNGVSRTSNSLVSAGGILSKVYFPRLIIPMASLLPALVDYAIAFIILGALFLWYGIIPQATLLLVPLITFIVMVLVMGIGLWFGAMNVRFRDISHALPFGLQLLMFATPVIYPTSLVPQSIRPFLFLNPMVGIMDAYRGVLFGHPFDVSQLMVSVLVAFMLLVSGIFVFHRVERTFADVV